MSEQNPFSVPTTTTDDEPGALRAESTGAWAGEEESAQDAWPASDEAALTAELADDAPVDGADDSTTAPVDGADDSDDARRRRGRRR